MCGEDDRDVLFADDGVDGAVHLERNEASA
jgi:hypothetical protein